MSDPDNYRGIQLTAQLSKATERLIAALFVPRLERIGAFGMHQFAYRRRRGARDALLHLILSCLHSFSLGHRIVVYCSDVSGAFDRVDADRLRAKLRSFSVPEQVVDLLASWLRPRSARVVVGGQQSHPIQMSDMVYQGTVLGPVLWITYFGDACMAVRVEGFDEIIFADDLTAWKDIPADISDAAAFRQAASCQRFLHEWGRANRVRFVPSKESTRILSRSRPAGEDFKLLGVTLDTKLLMHDAVEQCVVGASWRVYSLVRSKRYHTDAEMMCLFKAHVLSYIEYRNCAISHASASVLVPLDDILVRFLRSLQITPLQS